MSINTASSANEILNRVAVEIGAAPIADPFGSDDPTFVRLKYLLNVAGEELVEFHKWEQLLKEHQIITVDGDTGVYDLPDDFSHMVNQTGWERSQQTPLGGPLTSEAWAYLKGRNLASNSLYISFRIAEGKFNVFPDTPPAGLDINFEYVSTGWVRSATQDPEYTYTDEVTAGNQTPVFNRTLISRYLKLKMLEATGFDTTKAQDDFNTIFSVLTGSEKGAPILNAGGSNGYPYIGYGNVPITGFGV
jgi:hypothetical protein